MDLDGLIFIMHCHGYKICSERFMILNGQKNHDMEYVNRNFNGK